MIQYCKNDNLTLQSRVKFQDGTSFELKAVLGAKFFSPFNRKKNNINENRLCNGSNSHVAIIKAGFKKNPVLCTLILSFFKEIVFFFGCYPFFFNFTHSLIFSSFP